MEYNLTLAFSIIVPQNVADAIPFYKGVIAFSKGSYQLIYTGYTEDCSLSL